MIDTSLAPDGTISPARADEGGSGRAGGAVPPLHRLLAAADRIADRSVRQPNGCLHWTGARNSAGTAVAGIGRYAMPVSRLVWLKQHGELPTFKLERTCGDTQCVEVSHLRPYVSATLEERLWSRVDAFGPPHPYDASLGRCWLWNGPTLPTGYGRLHAPEYGDYAHRAAYGLANNCVPKLFILHSCDRPGCCNPAHLREGTPAENVADREARNRGNRFGRKDKS